MAAEHERFPVTDTHWRRCYRIVPARFPPISLFEGLFDTHEEHNALLELEGLTSSRLREQAGEIELVAREDRRFGPGYTPIMAAMCYPAPGRFSAGTFGVYYGANTERTAVAETRFHRERFMRESHQGPMNLEMRVYIAELRAPLVDLRGGGRAAVSYLDPDDWHAGQRLGESVWRARHYGILYPSVRDPASDAECAAVLRPPALSAAKQAKHFEYRWDGTSVAQVVELRSTPYS